VREIELKRTGFLVAMQIVLYSCILIWTSVVVADCWIEVLWTVTRDFRH